MSNSFIIHIADPSPFLDDALNLFEKVMPKKNVVFLRHRKAAFEVSAVDTSKIHYKDEDSDKYDRKLSEYISKSLGVIIHNLYDDYKQNLILALPQTIPVVLFSWGGDLGVVFSPYAPLTYRLLLHKHKHYHVKLIRYYIRDYLCKYNLLRILFFKLGWRKNHIKAMKAIERTNFIATVIPDEFDLLLDVFDYKGDYVRWNYGNDHLHSLNGTASGNKILVGHSGTEVNNHLDCFAALKRINVKQDIVFFCAYGGDQNYREHLTVTGKKLFGTRFHVVADFMGYQEYAKLLESFSAAIMGQYWQQGLGTANILLWQGTKLFLSERNPMYSFLKTNRIHVFSIEKELASEPIDRPLNHTQIQENRTILQQLYGQEQLLTNTQALCDLLAKKKQKLML